MAHEHTDPRLSTEIIKDRLYFCTLTRLPQETSSAHFFCIDDTLRYEPFFNDFGPLNLNLTYKFCQILLAKLHAPEHAAKVIYYYCANRPQNKSNAAVLIGAYLIIYGGRTSTQAYEPLKALEPYMPFRDASQQLCTFRLLPQHCLRALSKALKFGWFNFDEWNSAMYEHYETPDHGDLNLIIPGRFLAFSGPHATNISPEGYPTLTPTDYIPIFRQFGVTHVIRLNKKCYEKRDFVQAGLGHTDLYHLDGSTPSQAIADKFLQVCEQTQGVIAVHCKAGLGRTGTTMGLYIMKHYHLTAAETIAWLRICRPGMVIGPQQHYLKLQEPIMWKRGKAMHAHLQAQETPASTASAAASALNRTPVRRSAADSSAEHPASLPSYASSQPSTPQSPLSPASASGGSYSASFDTPPSMYQQKINGGYHPHHSHNHHPSTASTSSSSSASSAASSSAAAAAPASASSHPQTRSMSAAAAALHSRGASNGMTAPAVLGALQSRGRSKLPVRESASPTPQPHLPEHADKDLQATKLVEMKRSRVSGGGAVGISSPSGNSPSSSSASAAAARNLFDSKSWITSSPGRARAPSANGLRRSHGAASASSAASSTYSPTQLSSLSAASLYLSQPLSLSSASSSGIAAGGKAKATTRSSSQAPPGLQFRQSKR